MASTALYPYAVAVGGILALLALWLLVQFAWRRTFAVGGDALAARPGSGGCAHEDRCGGAVLDGACGRGARGDERSEPSQKAG